MLLLSSGYTAWGPCMLRQLFFNANLEGTGTAYCDFLLDSSCPHFAGATVTDASGTDASGTEAQRSKNTQAFHVDHACDYVFDVKGSVLNNGPNTDMYYSSIY